MQKKTDKIKEQKYPGVSYDKETKKYVAVFFKDSIKYVATKSTFNAAKKARIEFEKM